jgi:hypothetical protein
MRDIKIKATARETMLIVTFVDLLRTDFPLRPLFFQYEASKISDTD